MVGGQFEVHIVRLLECGLAPGKPQSIAHVHTIVEVYKGYFDDGWSGFTSIGKTFVLLFPSRTKRRVQVREDLPFLLLRSVGRGEE